MTQTHGDQSHGTRLADEFDRAAPRYDLLTSLNPGYLGALADAATDLVVRLVGPIEVAQETAREVAHEGGHEPITLWDLGCGSGLSTRALVDAAGPGARIVGVDSSAGMLDQARAKEWPAGVEFHEAFAQELPDVAARALDGPADGAFAAYLMRNVPPEQRDEVVSSIAAQVRPGGWIALQDYHVKGSRIASATWTAVCWGIVTPLALAVRGNPSIYRYLWRSVLENDSREELQARLERAGLTDITWSTAGGWQRGILHTVVARRPA